MTDIVEIIIKTIDDNSGARNTVSGLSGVQSSANSTKESVESLQGSYVRATEKAQEYSGKAKENADAARVANSAYGDLNSQLTKLAQQERANQVLDEARKKFESLSQAEKDNLVAMDEQRKATDAQQKSIDALRNEADKMNAEFDRQKEAADSSSFSFTELSSAIGLVEKGVGYLKNAFDFAQEGAQLERLRDSSNTLANGYGEDMGKIVAALKNASMGTVSETQLMLAANRAMMLGVGGDAEKLSTLMEIAAYRGRALGSTTSQAFSDIVTGIGRASPMILDNLGIVINAEEAQKLYADSVGKSADQLTEAEKKQSLLNAVLVEGKAQLESAGGLAKDNATSYERFGAASANLTEKIKVLTGDAFVPLIDKFSEAADGWGQMFQAIETSKQLHERQAQILLEQGKSIQQNTLSLNGLTAATIDEQKAAWDQARAELGAASAIKENKQVTVENTDAKKENKDAIEALSKTYSSELSAMVTTQGQIENYNSSMENLRKKQHEARDALHEAIQQGWWPTSQHVQDLKEKVKDFGSQMTEAGEKYSAVTKKMAYDNLVAKLSADGLKDSEFEMAQKAGVALGIFTQGTADQTIALNNLTSSLADGKITIADFQKAVSDGSYGVKKSNDDISKSWSGLSDLIQSNTPKTTDKINEVVSKNDDLAGSTENATGRASAAWWKYSQVVKDETQKSTQAVNDYITALTHLPNTIVLSISTGNGNNTPQAPRGSSQEINNRVTHNHYYNIASASFGGGGMAGMEASII